MATDGRPAQPKSILRGHKAQVHAAVFVRGNERLVTGDADGFVVAWDLTIMRPRAVWKAHDNAILGIAEWGSDRLITHGRDNKLIVWRFMAEDERPLSTRLPLDPSQETRPQPWILYMLEVNTMNFCSFSYCPASSAVGAVSSEILIAVPNTLASEAIDIFHLPSQARQHTVKLGDGNGMVMALLLFRQDETLTLVAGYENGMATVAQLDSNGNWTTRYQAKCHSQPILSLDVSPNRDFFLTSSADALIAKHPLPSNGTRLPQPSMTTTTTTPKPAPSPGNPKARTSLLTAALADPGNATPTPVLTKTEIQTSPLKITNTKHAGQQSLHIRSDARLFATAGWDAKVRVYSARTLAEVAVLKWHAVGCYAAAFAEVLDSSSSSSSSSPPPQPSQPPREGSGKSRGGVGDGGESRSVKDGVLVRDEDGEGEQGEGEGEGGSKEVITVPRLVDVTVKEKRVRQARMAHWLAAGSKDGKVSLWDVF